jgi:hypothetical protein
MGTASEWMHVLESGIIFGLAMLLFDAVTGSQRVATWVNVIGTAVASVLFGMMNAFGWRVLHGRLAVLFAGILLVAFAAGFAVRRANRRAEIGSKAS